MTDVDCASHVLTALQPLLACRHLAELAPSAASAVQALLPGCEVLVSLRSSDGDFMGGQSSASVALERWAFERQRQGLSGLVRDGRYLASPVEEPARADHSGDHAGESSAERVRGWVAVAFAENGAPPAAERVLEAFARLMGLLLGQLMERLRAAQALGDAQTSLAKGLHDLRTPLNSLRLGMHLLEPGLAGQDPAVVQRTHRAVDRMAALVTEMFDALHKN